MAINKNHEFEDLDGVKCAIVEKNASQERVDFVRQLLSLNGYTVIVAKSPPPKTAAKAAAAPGEAVEGQQSWPETFTIGVTDVTFNVTNALFGRLLKTSGGHVVTPAFWAQKDPESHDEIPYYEYIAP